MSDVNLQAFKMAMTRLEAGGQAPQRRFVLLRQTLALAMKCAATGVSDPAVWRLLGDIELTRQSKYYERSLLSPNARQWRSRIGKSFDRAAEYFERAAKEGDSLALRRLGDLYNGVYTPTGSGVGRDRTRSSRALSAFRRLAKGGATDVYFKIYTAIKHYDRRDRFMGVALAYLRQACRHGDPSALLELADLTYRGKWVQRDDEEIVRLLDDTDFFYRKEQGDEPFFKARMDYLRGVCLYHGLGIRKDEQAGLALIRGGAAHFYESKQWIEAYDRGDFDKIKPVVPPAASFSGQSPLRYFAASYNGLRRNKAQLIEEAWNSSMSLLAGQSAGKAALPDIAKPPMAKTPVASAAALLAKNEEDILAPLDALVGVHDLKDKIAHLVQHGKMQALRRMNGLPSVPLSMHMAFLGAPGTGKTTAARLVAKVLGDAGLLQKGHMVETDRSGLIGEYVGQTTKLTRAKLDQATGGVLFIDEAYALNKSSDRDYGHEAIETILKFMDDRHDEIMVIVAGYADPMQKFLHSNPGLSSRFSHMIEFPVFSGTDAASLFARLCENHQYVLADSVRESAKRYFTQIVRNGSLADANGRGVRTLFEQMITRQSRRVVGNRLHGRSDIVEIRLEDLPWDTGRDRLHIVGNSPDATASDKT